MTTGSLDREPPADLLRRYAKEGATGCLRLHQADEDAEAAVWFREGAVYTAAAPGARARLGDRLVGAGHITDEQLAATLERQQALPERRRIGELLIEGGLIDRETMRTYVQEQIADSVAVALGWTSGTFRFSPGEEVGEDVPLDASVENLLMEGARRLDEWEVISRRIGSLDAVVDFAPSGGTAELSLTPDEWSMLTRIDGSSSIRDIAAESGYGEFEAARIIYGLLTAGVVSLVDDEEEEEEEGDVTPEAERTGHVVGDDLEALLSELDPAPRAAPPPAEQPPERQPAEQPPAERQSAEQPPAEQPPARPVDRNELLREFAALDDVWGPAGGDEPEDVEPEEPKPAPPPRRPTRPLPEPEDKSKRGLFGRRKKE